MTELFENAVYIDSKAPQKTKNTGKQIKEFHHFVAPIEMNGGDYRVLITAREKVNSNTLYVVNAEILPNKKQGASAVGQKPTTIIGAPRTISVADLVNGVNIYDYMQKQNVSYTDSDIKYAEAADEKDSMQKTLADRLAGDELLDAEDLIAEIEDVAEISPDGYVTLYHRTTSDNAKRILETKKMSAKEDGIFFSTKENGEYSLDYGDSVVKFKVPVEKLVLDDIFSDEAHLRIPLENKNVVLDVTEYLTEEPAETQRNSLSDNTEDIAPLPGWNVKGSDIAYDDLPMRSDAVQQSSPSNVTEIEVGDKKYILNDSDSVSYSTLVKKGNIVNTTIEEKYSESNDYDLQERIKTAIDSCEKVVEDQGYVKLNSYPYTIRITKEGLRHGLVGKRLSGKRKRITGKEFEHKNIHYNNANICESFGEIIKNSIIVNELGDRSGGLVLMGYATSPGGQYVVRTIVKKVGDSYSIESWDSNLNLKAVNTKKIETQRVVDDYPTEQENNSTSDVSNISIEDFLQIVNDVSPEFADTLSGDVLIHLNGKRSENPSIAVRFTEENDTAAELEEDTDVDDMAAEVDRIVAEKYGDLPIKLENSRKRLSTLQSLRESSKAKYENRIKDLQTEYDSLKNKETKRAYKIQEIIANTQRQMDDTDVEYGMKIDKINGRISDIEAEIESAREKVENSLRSKQAKTKKQEYINLFKKLIGDTATWVDKKFGLQYEVNTLRRNLRDVVRDADGKKNYRLADAIYDELQGKYNHHEALLNRESNNLKKAFADMKITKEEDAYIQMLGEC